MFFFSFFRSFPSPKFLSYLSFVLNRGEEQPTGIFSLYEPLIQEIRLNKLPSMTIESKNIEIKLEFTKINLKQTLESLQKLQDKICKKNK